MFGLGRGLAQIQRRSAPRSARWALVATRTGTGTDFVGADLVVLARTRSGLGAGSEMYFLGYSNLDQSHYLDPFDTVAKIDIFTALVPADSLRD